jgi:AGCS family alanine or glycine:cation symporter
VLGWAYYGERCVEYCLGRKALVPYRLLYIAVAALAPVVALDVVWTAADILNALMAVPNLIAVLLLTPVIMKETKRWLPCLDETSEEEVPTIE